MEIYNSSERRGEAEGRAPLNSQVGWRVLAVVVAVCVLAAVDIDHGRLNVDVAQLVFDSQQVRVAVDHVGGQRMAQQVGPHAAVDTGALRQYADDLANVLRLQLVAVPVRDEKQVIRKERFPLGLQLSLARGQILFEYPKALAGNRDSPLLVELAFLQAEHTIWNIDVADSQIAELVIADAAVSEHRDDGLLAHAVGGVQHDGDFGLGKCDRDAHDALLGPREVDRISHVFGESLQGADHNRQVAVRVLAVAAHDHDERFEIPVRWVTADQRIGAAQNSEVERCGSVVDLAVGVQVRLEAAQKTFAFIGNRRRFIGSHDGPSIGLCGQSRCGTRNLAAARFPLSRSWQRSATVDRCFSTSENTERSWVRPCHES